MRICFMIDTIWCLHVGELNVKPSRRSKQREHKRKLMKLLGESVTRKEDEKENHKQRK